MPMGSISDTKVHDMMIEPNNHNNLAFTGDENPLVLAELDKLRYVTVLEKEDKLNGR